MPARKNPPRIHHTFITQIKTKKRFKQKPNPEAIAIRIAAGEKSRKLRADTREANIEISRQGWIFRFLHRGGFVFRDVQGGVGNWVVG